MLKAVKYLVLIAGILTVVSLQSCTSNDGDIGPWFGSWSLTAMTADGNTPADFVPGNTVWEFQGDVVHITRRGDHGSLDRSSWGTWTETDHYLRLNFTHSQTGVEPGSGDYSAPTWLGLPTNAVSDLKILSMSGRKLQLSYYAPNGTAYNYTLEKTW